jgi:hypothetical protein
MKIILLTPRPFRRLDVIAEQGGGTKQDIEDCRDRRLQFFLQLTYP